MEISPVCHIPVTGVSTNFSKNGNLPCMLYTHILRKEYDDACRMCTAQAACPGPLLGLIIHSVSYDGRTIGHTEHASFKFNSVKEL